MQAENQSNSDQRDRRFRGKKVGQFRILSWISSMVITDFKRQNYTHWRRRAAAKRGRTRVYTKHKPSEQIHRELDKCMDSEELLESRSVNMPPSARAFGSRLESKDTSAIVPSKWSSVGVGVGDLDFRDPSRPQSLCTAARYRFNLLKPANIFIWPGPHPRGHAASNQECYAA